MPKLCIATIEYMTRHKTYFKMSPNLSWNSQGSLYRCSDLGLPTIYSNGCHGSSWNKLVRYGVSNLQVQSLKCLGKGSFWQRVLQIIRLNTLVDVIRVPKVRTSGE